MHASVTWIVPVALDSAPIPHIRMGSNGTLSDHHIVKLDDRGIDECVRLVRDLIVNPALNMASIRLSSTKLSYPSFIEVNDRLLTTSGEFISVQHYKEEYQKRYPTGNVLDTIILDVFALKRDSTREFLVTPGRSELRVVHMRFERPVSHWGPTGNVTWSFSDSSNALLLQLRAKERKSLLVRDSASGFLWRNKLCDSEYYLTEA
jgi:hypothetical protein